MSRKKQKALIAMSGGVDSSLAAKLVTDMGFSCIGCTMKLYDKELVPNTRAKTCCSLSDTEDARNVAYQLGMPYYVFNYTKEFRDTVIEKFIHCYECGETPNPCIDCNRYMKFGKLYERAKILGCDYIVTGHYARIEEKKGRYILKKALDETKDQSYVLYAMTQEQLAHTLFPLGNLRKNEVRVLAEEQGFLNAHKPDSQDICFVPDGDYASVIEAQSMQEARKGYFVDRQGNVIKEHKGIIHYTIGQRKRLGISASEPLYVCEISPKTGNITLGNDGDLYRRDAKVKELNWIDGVTPKNRFRCKAKIRYRQKEQWATVIPSEDSKVLLIFDEKQRAITAGQTAVFYDGDVVLGGGVIEC